MFGRRKGTRLAGLTVLGAFVWPLLLSASSVAAESANIDHVQPEDGVVKLLYSVPALDSAQPELGTVRVTIDGTPVEASAELAADSGETIRRTAILAMDVSNSMQADNRFTEAKLAANAFLEAAPADVHVGLVAFAGEVTTVQEPTLDREAVASAVEGLSLSLQTRLYDGVTEAVGTAGVDGQRSILVLSDGKDTSSTKLADVSKLIEDSEVKVDVVALGQSGSALGPLEEMARAGQGAVIPADDPKSLTQVFSAEADVLAKQVLITVPVPRDMDGTEGSVAVSIVAGGETYTDSAFVTLASKAREARPTGPREVPPPRFAVSQDLMLVGLGVAGLGVLVVLLNALGVFEKTRTETLEDRIAAYSRTKDPRAAAGTPGVRIAKPAKPESLTASAVGVAQKALGSNKGLEAKLGARIEAAGMAVKPAEWLLAHAGIAVGAGVLGFLLSSGGLMLTVLLAAVGIVLPWFYLGRKKKKRLKNFDGQLADVLQLMSGSLSAGLSLAQSVDTVVREGTEPVAGEFRRALIEARLGVQVEDALDAVAERMDSDDFHWVVMAIRIQREVGGNLAELLLTVASTLREREYLRRQVKALSAEGRMSAYILGGLPPAFIAYLSVINPEYLSAFFTSPLGWLLMGTMVVLISVGGFWMSKLVKVEV